jgi:putative ABC transport system substrate-binding protein
MRRREFIAGVGSAAAWPLAAHAQQPAMPTIGFLNSVSADGYAHRWAEGQNDRLPGMAADLARRQVRVIAANTLAALASKAATTTIPIVFVTSGDPVELGLVASLNRPGGNVTGVTTLNVEVGPKLLELLHELIPTAKIIAVLVNPTNPNLAEPLSRDLHAAARTLGLQLHVLHASTERDFDTVFATIRQLRAGALVIGTDALFTNRGDQLAALTLLHALPTIYGDREFVAGGGLMSYGGSFLDAYRQLGLYTGRILKGDNPADLPVQQATRIEQFVNLKTAKALGITIPEAIMVRADEVFE